MPDPVDGNQLELEGCLVRFVNVGRTDTGPSSMVHIPELATVVSGDVAYNGIHMWMTGSSPSPLDLTTSSGRMQARIAGVVAQQEVEHTGERRARAAEQKAALGLSNGSTRGFGYAPSQVVKDEDGAKRYIYNTVEHEAVAIRKAAEALLRGKSARSIWKEWNERGLLTPQGNA